MQASKDQISAAQKAFLAASAFSLAANTLAGVIGGNAKSPSGASTGSAIGGGIGSLAGIPFGPVGAIIGSSIGSVLGSLIGGAVGPEPDRNTFDPDIFVDNTSKVEENTLAIRENNRVLNDLRSQLINAPGGFSLPAFAAFGGGVSDLPPVTTQQGSNPVFSPNNQVSIVINGNADAGTVNRIREEVNKALDDVYGNQARQFGSQRRLG